MQSHFKLVLVFLVILVSSSMYLMNVIRTLREEIRALSLQNEDFKKGSSGKKTCASSQVQVTEPPVPIDPQMFKIWEANAHSSVVVLSGQRERLGCSLAPFEDVWNALPWDQIAAGAKKHGFVSWKDVRMMQEVITPYLLSVSAPLEVIKRPDPLVLRCDDPIYSAMLTGKKRAKKVRLFDVTSFGYDLDMLEIRLYQLQDSVDMTVIHEGTYTHRGVRKALFFEQARERFLPFLNKILHVISDDSVLFKYQIDENDLTGKDKSYVDDWRGDSHSKRAVFDKLYHAVGDLNEDDLVLWSDLDELPDSKVLLVDDVVDEI